jgi:hypothetical protein
MSNNTAFFDACHLLYLILRSRDKITRVWSTPQDLPEKQILDSRQEQAPQKVQGKKKVSRHLN